MAMSVPTIEAFIGHRWVEAMTELARLDPDFFDSFQTALRLDRTGLVTVGTAPLPSRSEVPLSREWHRLLEALWELSLRVNCLKTAAGMLSPSAHVGKSEALAGREAIYHVRSCFMHVMAVAEAVDSVIYNTVGLFAEGKKKTTVAKRYKDRVRNEVKKEVKTQRNAFLHATEAPWASALTENRQWELLVAIGMLPDAMYEMRFYPGQGRKVQGGAFGRYQTDTDELLRRVAAILHDLEVELGLVESEA